MSSQIQHNDSEDRPQKQTLCQSLRRDSHIKCLLLTVLIIGCLCVITWCSFAQVTRMVVNFQSYPITTLHTVSPCDEGYIYIPIVFMTMLYIVYLVECWHCTTRLELIYRMSASKVYNHIEQMTEAQPIIWWKAVCYHYVRRTRQVTRYRNGDAYTTAQIYYERINSHVAGSCFSYGGCGVKDISKKLIDLELHPVTKIQFSKGFAFANIEAANEFEEQRSNFFRDNERFDDYLEMREGLDLVGSNFQEYMVSHANSDNLPWYTSHLAFWLFSLLLLSWPFRVIIEYKTSYLHYQVIKLFGEHCLSPTSELCDLSRDSTIDSVELISNYTMAPSYSEALLVERFPLRTEQFPVNIENEISGQLNSGKASETLVNRSSNRLRNSYSRTSLRNGQIVYFVAPLLNESGESVIRRLSLLNYDSNENNEIIENPPTYEEVLLESHPLQGTNLFNLNPLRRSITDRDFFRRLTNHLVRPWNSYIDLQMDFTETQL